MRNFLPVNVIQKGNRITLIFSILFLLHFLCFSNTYAQSGSVGVGTTTPNKHSALEIQSIDKGLLIPRLTEVQKTAVFATATAPEKTAGKGLMIYNIATDKFNYWDGTKWNDVGTSSAFVPTWYFGSENPKIDVPATGVSYTGVPNDYYFNINSGVLFLKNSSNLWTPQRTLGPGNEVVRFKTTFKTTISNHPAISVGANSSKRETFSVANAFLGSVVTISPKDELVDGIIISYAKVSATGQVEVKFTNVTNNIVNIPVADYHIAITN